MALPAVVLVHGAQHAADCWDLTVEELHRQAPHLKVVAVDLPGRRGKSGELIGARIDDWVRNERKGKGASLPRAWATFAFCNGMTRAQREFALARFYPESPSIAREKVYRTDMPDNVPRTWILTSRDRTFSPTQQRASIEAIGGVQTVISIDTCHDLMISEPKRMAEILVERCGLRAT